MDKDMDKDMPMGGYSASIKREVPKNLVVSRVEVEPSENDGFVVRCFKKETKADRSRSTYPGYYEPEVYTFESFESLSAFLKKTF